MAWVGPDLLKCDSTVLTDWKIVCLNVLEDSSYHKKWELAPTSICVCDALDRTAAHVILKCLLHRAPKDSMDCWSWMTRQDAG